MMQPATPLCPDEKLAVCPALHQPLEQPTALHLPHSPPLYTPDTRDQVPVLLPPCCVYVDEEVELNAVHDALLSALEKVVARDSIVLHSEKCSPMVEYSKCASHYFSFSINGLNAFPYDSFPYQAYFTIERGRRISMIKDRTLERDVNLTPRVRLSVLEFATYEHFAKYFATQVDTDLRKFCE
jgi:hypothetical protein